MLASCDFGGAERDRLKAQNDSLTMALDQRNAELDEIMGTFNEIQEGFRQINEAENRVDLQRNTDENSASVKEKIVSDIHFIAKTMEENRTQIAKLQQQLKNSSANSAQLRKAIESLKKELEEKEKQIAELRAELEAKNVRIRELDEAVSGLNTNVEMLTAENEAKAKAMAEQEKAIYTAWFVFGTKNELKAQTVAAQEKAMNTAWFVFGTRSELKEQKILQKGDVLQSDDFNKDYFTQIDIRTDREIKLYSKSAKLLTNHPEGSYSLIKDAKGQYILKITNPNTFWSVSRYLVIQVR